MAVGRAAEKPVAGLAAATSSSERGTSLGGGGDGGQGTRGRDQECQAAQVIEHRYGLAYNHGFAAPPVTTSGARAGQSSGANRALRSDDLPALVNLGSSSSARRTPPLEQFVFLPCFAQVQIKSHSA